MSTQALPYPARTAQRAWTRDDPPRLARGLVKSSTADLGT
jgi:hypothetical protein